MQETNPVISKEDASQAEHTDIAVLIPCYNEQLTVAEVVRQFRAQLADAKIYVFDNNSTDRTVDEAHGAGAIVSHEKRQGKGYVVQAMFHQIEADIYIMVDGDGTYPPASVHKLIEPILRDEADMVVGSRLHCQSHGQFRPVNRFGNKMVLSVLNLIFKIRLTDILSGYRAFSRRFVKSVPIFAGGFEIEAELTIKALEQHYRIVEIPTDLTHRPEGSHSKIRVIRDGAIILNTIFALFRDYKPLTFFASVGLILLAGGFIPGLVVIFEFIETGRILHMPSTVLAVGLVLSGILLIMVALILHTIVRRFRELEHQLRVLTGELSQKKPTDKGVKSRNEQRIERD